METIVIKATSKIVSLSCLFLILTTRSCHCTRISPKLSFCQEQSVLLGSEANMAKVVDAQIFAPIHIECHFCNEKGEYSPKIWYFKKRGSLNKPKEVSMDVNTKTTENRISITPIHTLIISNFSLDDSGIYSCQPINVPNESIFTYYLDAVCNDSLIPKSGKLSQWKEYKRSKLDPINEKFEKSKQPAFTFLRENFNFTFRLVTVWEPWGPCEPCGKPKGHAIKRKEGKCRLHPLLSNHVLPETNNSYIVNLTAFYLKDVYDVSCRSQALNDAFPELSEIVRNIPEFIETAACPGLWASAVPGSLTTNKDEYKYRTSHTITENSHLTLYCPETSLDSNVIWYKDNNVLNSTFRNNMADGEEEPNLTIDSFNSLYILHATKNEEGIFTCLVDGHKMQFFRVDVVSMSKLLSQEFLRYSLYLGFVLTLSLTCYCAGVCVAWRRRSSFADPLNLRFKDEAIEAIKCECEGKGECEETEPLIY